jgi:hypothetical protein
MRAAANQAETAVLMRSKLIACVCALWFLLGSVQANELHPAARVVRALA